MVGEMSKKMFSPFSPGVIKKIAVATAVGCLVWVEQAIRPPRPKLCGSPNGPPITAPRIKLRDGRHLAYKEYGVPKDEAKHKFIYVHGFRGSRDSAFIGAEVSPEIIQSFGLYIVGFDRPGYGESDPNPNRTPENMALDIEELADQLGLGEKFYVVGYSMGGELVWACLKYIPHSSVPIISVEMNTPFEAKNNAFGAKNYTHQFEAGAASWFLKLAGVTLATPVINYWWKGLPTSLSKEAYQLQLPQDQWALRMAHYAPWLTYWWQTQKLFPASSVVTGGDDNFSRQDKEIMSNKPKSENEICVSQQGEHESLFRDMIVGFGKWEFSPIELENPFPNNEGTVHLWQGEEDMLVPVALQRYIAQSLPWIHYHELPGSGHMFPYVKGMADAIIKAQLSIKD